jgi:hypothetical protein
VNDQATSPQDKADDSRWRYGLIAVAVGVAALVLAALIIVWVNPSNAASVLGVIASPVAAIIGAYFGVQVSGSAAKDAQVRAAAAEEDKTKAMADRASIMSALDPQKAQELMRHIHFQPPT